MPGPRRPLRVGLWVALGLALAWLVFAASPYVALYRLARAVQAHDLEGVARRVNVRALRLSLTRQTIAALAEAAGRRDLGERDRGLAADAAAMLVEPVVSALVTPETIADILDDGWPQKLVGERPPDAGGASAMGSTEGGPPRGRERGLHAATLAQLGRLWLGAESRGFRNLLISFPPDRPREARFRVRLRLSGWTWRLVDVELPADLRERISRRLGGELPARALPNP